MGTHSYMHRNTRDCRADIQQSAGKTEWPAWITSCSPAIFFPTSRLQRDICIEFHDLDSPHYLNTGRGMDFQSQRGLIVAHSMAPAHKVPCCATRTSLCWDISSDAAHAWPRNTPSTNPKPKSFSPCSHFQPQPRRCAVLPSVQSSSTAQDLQPGTNSHRPPLISGCASPLAGLVLFVHGT